MEDEYLDPGVLEDCGEDEVIITWSILTAEGMELWGGTFERGPFDDMASLRAQIASTIPLLAVSEPVRRGRYVIQLKLF